MYGAILGDMIGSPYEFNRGNKSKDFPLFVAESEFTDDTIMTIAVAEALMKTGAEATASAMFLARTGVDKQGIKQYVEEEFGYDLSRSCDEIRPSYYHVESCMETVPEAITAFLEGTDFEDVIRTAVSLGGDADTLTAIAGSIAEGYYGVPSELKKECYERVSIDIQEVLQSLENFHN